MRIMFCTTVYAIFNDRCRALAHKLAARGHEIAVVAYDRNPDDQIDPAFACTICDWPAFDFGAIHAFNPDMIIIWNGKFTHIHAAVCALRALYPSAIMEMGWLPQAKFSYVSSDLAQISPIAAIPYVPGVAAAYAAELSVARAQFPPLTDVDKLPTKFVFVPMQLEGDTQIIYTSPHFKTMYTLLGFLRTIVPSGIPIAVRNHPHEPDVERPPWVLDYTKHGKSIDIARWSNLVMGINSTLMAEALLFHKPVVAFGQHVAHDAFLQAHNMNDVRRLLDGDLPWDFRDRCDYRALTLLWNQWDNTNPPDWVVDQIVRNDFTPRTVPPPPPTPPSPETRSLKKFLDLYSSR